VIKITIEGPQGSGKSTLGMELMLLLASDKMLKKPWIRNAKKASIFLQDEESKTFKRLPYSMLPDVLIVLKQTTEREPYTEGKSRKRPKHKPCPIHYEP
jgi:shikimate kinase